VRWGCPWQRGGLVVDSAAARQSGSEGLFLQGRVRYPGRWERRGTHVVQGGWGDCGGVVGLAVWESILANALVIFRRFCLCFNQFRDFWACFGSTCAARGVLRDSSGGDIWATVLVHDRLCWLVTSCVWYGETCLGIGALVDEVG